MSARSKWSFHCHPYVFFISAATIILFVIYGISFPEDAYNRFNAVQDFVIAKIGWLYILAVAFFLVFVIGLLFSRFGDMKLGKDDDEPEFNRLTWFSMLFSAGMGIGLLFFSVAEPISHFADPPPRLGIEAVGEDENPRGEEVEAEAASEALKLSFFHWGVHAWGIYIVLAMALAYFGFRHDLPLTLRSTLYPLIGDRIHGWIGNTVDILAVLGTLFGLATSLGLGVMQINAGLDYLDLLGTSVENQVILIAAITACATISVVSGIHKGIRRLSELNMLAGLLLALFVFLVGPTIFVLKAFVQELGNYTSSLVQLTFRTDAFGGEEGLKWQRSWTMFYWGWWLSWSPFVGMFVARVSRGRTIREFILGVLLAPTLVTFVWFGIFGNTAIHMEASGSGQNVGIIEAVSDSETLPTAMFRMLNGLPLSWLTASVAIVVVATFFVTSSDSASLVVDILTAGGDPDPPIPQRVFWAVSEGAVAAALLWAGGENALQGLQWATITTGVPLCLILLVVCYGLIRGLRAEVSTADPFAALTRGRHERRAMAAAETSAVPAAQAATAAQEVPPPESAVSASDWRSRLREIIEDDGHIKQARSDTSPSPSVEQAREQIRCFIDETVVPAFQELKEELENYGREAAIEKDQDAAAITVTHDGAEEFSYAIRGQAYHKLSFAYPEFNSRNEAGIYQAEVVLRSGQQQPRAVKSFTRQSIIEDFLDEYAKWMGW